MRASQSDVAYARRKFHRTTYLQAFYISIPASMMALYHLLIAVGFYFKPLVLLGLVQPGKWQPLEVSPAVEMNLAVGIPFSIAAIGVYVFAVQTLSRVKAGKPLFRTFQRRR